MKINYNNVSLRISAGFPSQFPRDGIPHIAFSGRSNVGKSSLVNCLLNRKSLARVSGQPGKTITVNFYDVDKKLFFVDLPGYGFAKRSAEDQKRWSGLVETYLTKSEELKLVIQLVDIRTGPTDDDIMMINMMIDYKIKFVVVATKTDKLSKSQLDAALSEMKSTVFAGTDIEVIPFSSVTRVGKDDVWNKIIGAAF